MGENRIPEINAPAEEPPPYTEMAEGGSVSVDQGAGVANIRRWDVQTTRPSNSSATSTASNPPAGPPPVKHEQPPPGPPPRLGPRPSHSSAAGSVHSGHRPPPGPPPSHNRPDSKLQAPHNRPSSVHSGHSGHSGHSSYSGHSGHSSYGGHPNYAGYGGGGNGYGPPQGPPQGNRHLRYPPGFFCPKCHNTGVKVKKGTTCKSCYERFGVPLQAQYMPSGMMPIYPVMPRVVSPGDPSIGGTLCGRCRGTGVIHELFLFEDTCPICHGVGRLF